MGGRGGSRHLPQLDPPASVLHYRAVLLTDLAERGAPTSTSAPAACAGAVDLYANAGSLTGAGSAARLRSAAE
jgi:hypothetical protein